MSLLRRSDHFGHRPTHETGLAPGDEAAMKKAAKEEKERFDAYMEEYNKLYKEASARFEKARDKYAADMVKYNLYLEHVDQWGPVTNKRKVVKEPKKPEFEEPTVPNARHRFGVHFDGGRRRTRRGRKTRSTRRR
jgi:hypothetical protein